LIKQVNPSKSTLWSSYGTN